MSVAVDDGVLLCEVVPEVDGVCDTDVEAVQACEGVPLSDTDRELEKVKPTLIAWLGVDERVGDVTCERVCVEVRDRVCA